MQATRGPLKDIKRTKELFVTHVAAMIMWQQATDVIREIEQVEEINTSIEEVIVEEDLKVLKEDITSFPPLIGGTQMILA